jgi:hypothetical protein
MSSRTDSSFLAIAAGRLFPEPAVVRSWVDDRDQLGHVEAEGFAKLEESLPRARQSFYIPEIAVRQTINSFDARGVSASDNHRRLTTIAMASQRTSGEFSIA